MNEFIEINTLSGRIIFRLEDIMMINSRQIYIKQIKYQIKDNIMDSIKCYTCYHISNLEYKRIRKLLREIRMLEETRKVDIKYE